MYDGVNGISFPAASFFFEISTVAIIWANSMKTMLSPKCLPGQILSNSRSDTVKMELAYNLPASETKRVGVGIYRSFFNLVCHVTLWYEFFRRESTPVVFCHGPIRSVGHMLNFTFWTKRYVPYVWKHDGALRNIVSCRIALSQTMY